MSNPLHDIDKLFKNAIDDHGEMPASSVWEAVDKSLDKKSFSDIKRKYRLLKRVAAALLLLLIGSGIYMVLMQSKNSKPDVVVNTKQTEPKKGSNVAPVPSAIPEQNKNNTERINSETISASNTDEYSAKDSDVKNKQVNISNNKSTNNIESAEQTPTQQPPLKSNYKKAGRVKTSVTNGETDEIAGTEMSLPIKETAEPIQNNSNNSNEYTKITRLPAGNITTINAADLQKKASWLDFTTSNIPIVYSSTLYKKSNPAGSKKGGLSFTPFWGPNLASFHLEDDHHGRHHEEDIDDIKNDEHDLHSSTVGLLVDIPIKKNWSIQSGISLTSKTINIEPKRLFADFDNDGDVQYLLNCSAGYAFVSPKTGVTLTVGDSIETNHSVTKLQYVAVPLAIKYHYDYKNFTLFGTAGAALNFLTKGNIETEMQDNSFTDKNAVTTINGLKSSYLSGSLGAGLEYKLTKNLALSFMPSYNFALSSITQNAAVKSYPNSLSIATGLRFSF